MWCQLAAHLLIEQVGHIEAHKDPHEAEHFLQQSVAPASPGPEGKHNEKKNIKSAHFYIISPSPAPPVGGESLGLAAVNFLPPTGGVREGPLKFGLNLYLLEGLDSVAFANVAVVDK